MLLSKTTVERKDDCSSIYPSSSLKESGLDFLGEDFALLLRFCWFYALCKAYRLGSDDDIDWWIRRSCRDARLQFNDNWSSSLLRKAAFFAVCLATSLSDCLMLAWCFLYSLSNSGSTSPTFDPLLSVR